MEQTNQANIERLVEEWHTSDSSLAVHEYLGITFEQYAHWVETDIFLTNL